MNGPRGEAQSRSRRRSPANFNAEKPSIDPANAVMLVIDHQSGLFRTVGDMPMPEMRGHASALAKMAKLSKLPVVTTASVPQGLNGPMIIEIHENKPRQHLPGLQAADREL